MAKTGDFAGVLSKALADSGSRFDTWEMRNGE